MNISPWIGSVLALAITHPAQASNELAQRKACTACHAVDKALYGPAFLAVATRYRDRPEAAAMLAEKIVRGGSGAWGTAAMPANAVTADEARALAAWVLAGAPGTAVSPAATATPSTAARPTRPTPSDAQWRQGRYLVDNVMGCGNCHAGRTPQTDVIAGRELSGGRIYDTPMFYAQHANLTSDAETGLGAWGSEDIVRALTRGVRANGTPLAPMMPSAFYKALTPQDAQAIAAYLGTVAPVSQRTVASQYRQAWKIDPYPDAELSYDPAAMSQDKALRGRYLAALAHCMDCHTPSVNGATDFARDGGRGGRRFGAARVLAPNISSHPSAGVGNWSDAELRRALFEGKGRDGRTLQYPMPWPYLAGLTEFDRDSLIVWLRAQPPRD